MVYLVVIQKRSSLLVCWNNRLISANTEFLAENAWNANEQSKDEEGSHDGKSKDPLESNDLGEKLTDTKRSCEDTESKAHGVILWPLVFIC
jgi:hypothetical protein